MLYISESHGDGSTPLRLLAMPEVAKVRLMSGITATSLINRSLAWIASWFRLLASVSLRSWSTMESKSLFE